MTAFFYQNGLPPERTQIQIQALPATTRLPAEWFRATI
jgi:hypothetical protein